MNMTKHRPKSEAKEPGVGEMRFLREDTHETDRYKGRGGTCALS